jgi:membrane fusion protein, multidrug efflux system
MRYDLLCVSEKPRMNMAETEHDSHSLKRLQRTRWMTGLTFLFMILGVIYFLYWVFVGRFYESTDDAYVSGNLVQVMPEISGHVTAILADETDFVTKGQPLIYLDKSDAEIALKNAEATLALTVRKVHDYYNNVEQMKAQVALQNSLLAKAQDDYDRRKGLVVNRVISAEDLQHAKIAVDSAKASVDLAKQQLAAAISLVTNSDLYHHPEVKQAEVALRNAYLNWRRTVIYAPDSGYIAKRPAEVGLQVNPNSVLMIIVPLTQVWVDANYKESQLKHLRIGQPAELIADAYGSSIKYKGTVVGLNPGAGDTFDLLPPQNATGNWIKIVQRLPVRIAINEEQLKKYPLRIGLSVVVTVDTSNRKGQALSMVSQNKIIYHMDDYTSDLKQADQLVNQILQSNAENVSYTPP